jgi:hypothetical protein
MSDELVTYKMADVVKFVLTLIIMVAVFLVTGWWLLTEAPWWIP